MNILTGLIAGAVVVLAYFLGVVTGTLFLSPSPRESGKSAGRNISKNEVPEPVVQDEERQRKIAEEQKAFTDCMSYSAVQAYERQNI